MSLFSNINKNNKNIAIIDKLGNEYTYSELSEMINNFAGIFEKGSKSLILVRGKNNIESLIGYLGGISSGNTVLMIDASIDTELFNNIVESYKPEFIWQPADNKGKGCSYNYKSYELIRTDYEHDDNLYKDLSLVMLTSGSTGSPKGARLTLNNINSNAKAIAEYLSLDDTERPITNLPINYVYGLSVINSHLHVGATILLTDNSIVQREFWQFFKEYNATSFSGVPYTYEMLKILNFLKMDLKSLRYFTQAGGKLNSKLADEFIKYSKEKNVKFFIMYGQTEATARMSYLPPELNDKKVNSIGIPIPGGRLSVRTETGEEICISSKEGTLYYEGDNVMLGYAQNRVDLSKGDELNGCLNTHDIAYFDEDSFYYITGRESRFIKIVGKRINLEEIEQYLKKDGFNCIVGGFDELIVVAATDKESSKEIKRIIIKKFKIDYENIDIYYVPELLKTSNGKIDYKGIFKSYKRG